MTHKAHTLCTAAGLLMLTAALTPAMTGCAGASPRRDRSGLNEINPALAHAQRRREQALEHYQRATELHTKEQPEAALAEYRKALELDDQLYAAWNNMGQLLMAQGNFADAVSAYQIASGIEPTDPRPEYNIGLVYQRVGWAQDAYEHFDKAIARDPNYLPALRGLIRSAQMMGTGDQALLQRIKQAQLRDTDDTWREYYIEQRYRVESLLDNN